MSAEPSPWPTRFWPTEEPTDAVSAASPVVLASALAVGVVAALILREQVSGSAYVLVGLGILVVALRARSSRLSPPQVGAAVVTVALLSVAVVRSAHWLVVLCLLAAWGVGTLAVVGGRTWTGSLLAGLLPALVPPRAARWARRAIAPLAMPGLSSRRTWVVAAITAGLVVVFGSLFAAADPAYASILSDALPSANVSEILRRILILAAITSAAIVMAFLAHQPPAVDALAPLQGEPVRRWEWAIPLTVLDLLFLSFVLVQLTVLFGGREHVLTTEGLSYAQYARQGFWQLLVVTALTLVVIAIAVRKAPRAAAADTLLVQVLLAALCVLALVVVASALHRMAIYEQEYGFTRLRLFVQVVELTLGGAFLLLLAAGVRMTGAWLPRAVVALVAAALLGLAAVNPDAYVADHNVARYERTGQIDVAYLAGLSADAVPALLRLPAAVQGCALGTIAAELTEGSDPWYDRNLARERARQLIWETRPAACPTTGAERPPAAGL